MKKDRDAAVDELLAATLKARAAAPTSDVCLDAETLSAWADGALDARERASAEAHAADCARCQELLAAMVRTLPPAEKTRWRMPTWGWLVPLTVAATALLVWVVVPTRAPVQVSEMARSVEQPEPAPLRAPAAGQSAGAPPAEQPPAEARKQVASESDDKASAVPPGNLRDRRDALELQKATPAPLPSPAPAPTNANALAEAVTIPPAAAPASPAAAAGAVANEKARSADASGAQAVASRRELTFAPVAETVIVSSNPATRFRLLRGGSVQRSADGGATWRTEATGATDTLTAGASPSPSVCWLVGPVGQVLLSIDGRSWRRLRFPEAVDLRVVAATDGENATVTTADGRVFVTADGGQTWSRAREF